MSIQEFEQNLRHSKDYKLYRRLMTAQYWASAEDGSEEPQQQGGWWPWGSDDPPP